MVTGDRCRADTALEYMREGRLSDCLSASACAWREGVQTACMARGTTRRLQVSRVSVFAACCCAKVMPHDQPLELGYNLTGGAVQDITSQAAFNCFPDRRALGLWTLFTPCNSSAEVFFVHCLRSASIVSTRCNMQ